MNKIRKTIFKRNQNKIKGCLKKNKRYTKKSNIKKKIFGGDPYETLYQKYKNLYTIEEPVITEYTPIILQDADLNGTLDISNKIIKNVIETSTYSLLPYYFSNFGSLETQDLVVSDQNSGNCVAFANMIIEQLNKKLKKYAIIIPATLPEKLIQDGYPLFGHVAVVLETETKIIIFEPAYFILTSIVVEKNGDPTTVHFKVLNEYMIFRYDDEKRKINVTKINGDRSYFYKMNVIQNPSLAVSYPINILNKRIPIIKYDYGLDEKKAHLSIRIDTQQLEGYNLNYNPSSDDHWYERFDWETCLDINESKEEQIKTLSNWGGFSKKQCRDLNLNRDELIEKVYSIIKTEWDKTTTIQRDELRTKRPK